MWDFPFKDLLSVKNGKVTDKLSIESSSFDMEKSENQNIKDESNVTFNIVNLSNIKITTIHTINDKIKSNITNIYFLNANGKFQKK